MATLIEQFNEIKKACDGLDLQVKDMKADVKKFEKAMIELMKTPYETS